MNGKDIYELSIKMGIGVDPRGKKGIQKHLDREKKLYEKLSKEEKTEFDKERLTNPYADTRFLTGSLHKQVRRVLVGIDIGSSEVLLAERLKDKGKGIDLIVSHHPEGKALAALDRVTEKWTPKYPNSMKR